MASRITAAELKRVINLRKDVSGFIELANLMVNENLLYAGLTDARLKQVELYLAAHFAAITTERGAISFDRIEMAEQRYDTRQMTAGLGSTRFGQQAIMLDTSGILGQIAAASSKNTFSAKIRVVAAPKYRGTGF